MKDQEIKLHEAKKSMDATYPKLPKFILERNRTGYKKPNKELQESCLRGFYKRVNNWERTKALVEA